MSDFTNLLQATIKACDSGGRTIELDGQTIKIDLDGFTTEGRHIPMPENISYASMVHVHDQIAGDPLAIAVASGDTSGEINGHQYKMSSSDKMVIISICDTIALIDKEEPNRKTIGSLKELIGLSGN